MLWTGGHVAKQTMASNLHLLIAIGSDVSFHCLTREESLMFSRSHSSTNDYRSRDHQPDELRTVTDLLRRVELAMRQSPFAQLHTISIRIDRGVVVLNGELPSYYFKQLAQSCVLRVAGVWEIRNDTIVLPDDSVRETHDSSK